MHQQKAVLKWVPKCLLHINELCLTTSVYQDKHHLFTCLTEMNFCARLDPYSRGLQVHNFLSPGLYFKLISLLYKGVLFSALILHLSENCASSWHKPAFLVYVFISWLHFLFTSKWTSELLQTFAGWNFRFSHPLLQFLPVLEAQARWPLFQ